MNVLRLLLATAGIMVGVLLLMVVSDIINPQTIEVTITPDMVVLPEMQAAPNITPEVAWEDDINNPSNQPFVLEVAFNEGIEVDNVTQAQFNARYLAQ